MNLIWTTWERWRSVHPETKVLSRRTGHLRNYSRDPYGRYNPIGGYYSQDRTMFPLMHTSDRYHQKEMVVGARTAERSVYFVMADLARERVLSTANFRRRLRGQRVRLLNGPSRGGAPFGHPR